MSVPQIGGMSRGDRARKMNLVEHGFRLPSALDNRPLNFEEWEKGLNQTLYVSATPGDYELAKTHGEVVEQVIRPTGLLDPITEVRPATTQVDNLLGEIRKRVEKGDRVMVTYSLGLGNGGMAPREAIWRYSGAVPIMTGSGASTPTRRQIEIARAWGVNVILGFPSYLRHMAIVAREEMGIDPHSLGIRTIGSHLGQEDRERIEALWNAPVHDAYGTHESGMRSRSSPSPTVNRGARAPPLQFCAIVPALVAAHPPCTSRHDQPGPIDMRVASRLHQRLAVVTALVWSARKLDAGIAAIRGDGSFARINADFPRR